MTTGSAPGRRERNKAQKRARILEAATRLLDEHGYEGTAMAQVAAAADVATGTVFQYAATKAELLMMVTAARWDGALPTANGDEDDPVEQIVAMLAPLAADAQRHPENAMAASQVLLFGAPGPHRDHVLSLVGELQDAVARILLAAGTPRPGIDVGAATRLVVSGGLLELNRSRTGRADPASVDDRLRALARLVVAGALAEPDLPGGHARDMLGPRRGRR